MVVLFKSILYPLDKKLNFSIFHVESFTEMSNEFY